MEGVADHKEDDAYSISTPQNLAVVLEKSKKESEMEGFFEKFWKKQEDFQKKQEEFQKKQEDSQKSFSAEMAAMVVELREMVAMQGKEIKDQRREITELREKVEEIEKKKVEGGSMIGEEVVDLMQGMIMRQVEESKEKAKRECQVRITGLKEDGQENSRKLRLKVVEVFEGKMKVEGAGAMIVDSFRIGKKGEEQIGRPRVVIVRLGSVGQRNEILRGKRNLGEWRSIGVDVDRTKEEVDAFKRELKKKKEVEEKGGKAALIKGKMVMLEAPPQEEREEEDAYGEGGGVQHTHRKGKKKGAEIAEGSLTRTRRSTRSAEIAKGSDGNAA
eukprot:TRINITY_DN2470_c0_g4_i2.p2 TRINITY_DN2470_c0_g4~~TRINITY_DN2470_c0_g4_i2.p2  ORF type:complete len:330 (+),score=135.79 TRINITY_DN2470_c0_g4_i2:254-1243(+)